MMTVENPSCVLYGPAGAGKASVAEALAQALQLKNVIEEWHHSSDVFRYRHHLYVTNAGHVPTSLFENGGRAYSVEEARAFLATIEPIEAIAAELPSRMRAQLDDRRLSSSKPGSAITEAGVITEWLKEASEPPYRFAILNERGATHGDYSTQAAFSQTLKGLLRARHPADMTPAMRESLDMICVKVSRLLYGDPAHLDSWVDIAGYANLIAETLAPKKAP